MSMFGLVFTFRPIRNKPDFICLCHAFTLTQLSRHRPPARSLGEKRSDFVIACL